jgi:hypothetical protein
MGAKGGSDCPFGLLHIWRSGWRPPKTLSIELADSPSLQEERNPNPSQVKSASPAPGWVLNEELRKESASRVLLLFLFFFFSFPFFFLFFKSSFLQRGPAAGVCGTSGKALQESVVLQTRRTSGKIAVENH